MKQIVGFFSVPHHNAIRTESAYSSVSWIMPSPGSFHLCVENRNYLLLLPQVRAKLETLILSSHAKLFCDLNIPNSCFFFFSSPASIFTRYWDTPPHTQTRTRTHTTRTNTHTHMLFRMSLPRHLLCAQVHYSRQDDQAPRKCPFF